MSPDDMLLSVLLGLPTGLLGNYIWAKRRIISKKLKPYWFYIAEFAALIIFVPMLWALIADVAIPKASLMINNGDIVRGVFVATGLSFFVGILIKPLFDMARHLTTILRLQEIK